MGLIVPFFSPDYDKKTTRINTPATTTFTIAPHLSRYLFLCVYARPTAVERVCRDPVCPLLPSLLPRCSFWPKLLTLTLTDGLDGLWLGLVGLIGLSAMGGWWQVVVAGLELGSSESLRLHVDNSASLNRNEKIFIWCRHLWLDWFWWYFSFFFKKYCVFSGT